MTVYVLFNEAGEVLGLDDSEEKLVEAYCKKYNVKINDIEFYHKCIILYFGQDGSYIIIEEYKLGEDIAMLYC